MNKSITLEESGYNFCFDNCISVIRVDEKNYTGLSFVDFIVETDTDFLFIEVKNPDNKQTNKPALIKFLKKFQDSTFPATLIKKFNDSLLSRLAMSQPFFKPIRYIFILEYQKFTKMEKLHLFDKVNNKLPFGLKSEIFDKVNTFELYSIDEFQLKYVNFFCGSYFLKLINLTTTANSLF